MEAANIDWLAVLIAAVLNMVIGFFWYSKWLFRKAWIQWESLKEKELKGNRLALLWGFLNSLVIAYFLAFFEVHLGVTTVSDGVFVGFCAYLGFCATTQIAPVIWERKPYPPFFLHTGCKLLSFLVMGGVLGA